MEGFVFHEVISMFPLDDITRSQFYWMESQGEIPQALRADSRKQRVWTPEMIPLIGAKLAPMYIPDIGTAIEIAIYISKGGGSYKTTFAYNFAKFLAMRGLKVLVIPLDFQQSMTLKFKYENAGSTRPGLCEVADGRADLRSVILKTNYPTLDIIPENSNLVKLDISIASKSFKEEYLSEILAPIKKDYQVIIYDNNPAWSNLALSSIYMSSFLCSPIGIDTHTTRTLPIFVDNMQTVFKNKKNINLTLIPGFVETNVAKQMNLSQIREAFSAYITTNEIRKSTTVDEANMADMSIFEYAPKSTAAEDFRRVYNEIWQRITKTSQVQQ